MEEKNFTATAMVLPRPRKKWNFTSITVVVPRLYLQMIWRNMMFYCYLFVILVLSEEANCLKNIHNARIFNGQNALENQFPWHIFVKVTFKDKTDKIGGGVLISKKHFLTCAHGFYHK